MFAHAAGETATSPQHQEAAAGYTISAIKAYSQGDDYVVRVSGSAEPAYTQFELVDPLRIVLDIADATIGKAITLPISPANGPVAKISSSPQEGVPSITRLEMFLADDPGYAVTREGNDIVVTFHKSEGTPSAAADNIASSASPMQLTSIDVDSTDTQTVVHLRAPAPFASYKYNELPSSETAPARLYIDLKNVRGDNVDNTIPVNRGLAQIRTAQRDGTLRVVFDASGDDLGPYKISSLPDGIEVAFNDAGEAIDPVAAILAQDDSTQQELADTKKSKTATATAAGREGNKETAPDTFSFAGFNQQRITVDFYKIDLHNVFRLIGEISGKNIVVDEGVGGSLTLALNDVPWDFALDVILNLKGLQKEERFNTIVVSPKSKAFQWPEKATDTLAIKADPLTINKRIEMPKEMFDAKQLLSEARRLEDQQDYEKALAKYEEAFQRWPDNAQIPSRMAALYLVQAKLFPQAVHYAKEAIRINPNDSNAALLAAVGLASMKKDDEAKQFFDLAVASAEPTSDALTSYAAFLEEGGNYPAALVMLERHGDMYGDNLDTIIDKARLYDKNNEPEKAVEEFRAALLSGYQLPQDLKRYINDRIATSDKP